MTKLALYMEFDVGKADAHPQKEDGLTSYEVLSWLNSTLIQEFKERFGYDVGFHTVCRADAGESDLSQLRMADWVKQKKRELRQLRKGKVITRPCQEFKPAVNRPAVCRYCGGIETLHGSQRKEA